jgi:rod shape-determining protein MreC
LVPLREDRRSRLLLGTLVVVHLIVISRQVDAGGGVSLFEKTVLAVLHPFQVAVAGSVGGVSSLWSDWIDLRSVRAENRRLRASVAALDAQLQDHQRALLEAQRLRALLDLRDQVQQPALAARVVARAGLPWFRTLVIDKGSESGVALNAPVVSTSGVVGRVIAVALGASKVQTLLDQHAGVGVLVERSRVGGIVSGQLGSADAAAPLLTLKYVPARADVVVGDQVLTSGLDRVFPKGLRVGQIGLVQPGSGLFQEILVTPATAFERIEEVLVLPAVADVPLATETPR